MRLYPNKGQTSLIERFFGCARFVHNEFVDENAGLLSGGKKIKSEFDMNYELDRDEKGESLALGMRFDLPYRRGQKRG
jgi:hypothetical protein